MKKLTLLWICLLLTIPSQAGIIYVDDDGPADFNNIQAAIDDSNDGDTILSLTGFIQVMGTTTSTFWLKQSQYVLKMVPLIALLTARMNGIVGDSPATMAKMRIQ